jgi:hypothetical protein
MFSSVNGINRKIVPIELKSTEAYIDITIQLQRYIDWLQQYYIPNRPSSIEPIIISRYIVDKTSQNYINVIQAFNQFNIFNDLKIKYIEFNINNNQISFNDVTY